MSKASNTLSREQRLAAKLRENLHRRKAQAREQAADDQSGDPPTLPKAESSR